MRILATVNMCRAFTLFLPQIYRFLVNLYEWVNINFRNLRNLATVNMCRAFALLPQFYRFSLFI